MLNLDVQMTGKEEAKSKGKYMIMWCSTYS